MNLANGRFLWRNRIGADEAEIRIVQIKKENEKTNGNLMH